MDHTQNQSEDIRQELDRLTEQLTQIQKMINAKKIILAAQEVMDAYYLHNDTTDQDLRYYS
jgi:hypothetical protein